MYVLDGKAARTNLKMSFVGPSSSTLCFTILDEVNILIYSVSINRLQKRKAVYIPKYIVKPYKIYLVDFAAVLSKTSFLFQFLWIPFLNQMRDNKPIHDEIKWVQ